MTVKEVILHVGFAKTATTTIQNTFYDNRSVLEAAGYTYANFIFQGRPISNHSLSMAYIFADDAKNHHINIKRGLDSEIQREIALRQLNAELDRAETLVISGEEISFWSVASLERARDFFLERKVKLRVIAYVRPTLSYLESLAQQFVKSGFPIHVTRGGSPRILIEKLSCVFENIEYFSVLDANRHEGGPVGHILDVLGIKVPLDSKQTFDNPSLSDNAARVASFINSILPIIKDGKLNSFRSEGDYDWVRSIKGPKFHLRASEVDVQWLKAESVWLSNKMGDAFSDDISSINMPVCQWGAAEVEHAARAIRKCPLPLLPVAHAYFATEGRVERPLLKFLTGHFDRIYFGKK